MRNFPTDPMPYPAAWYRTPDFPDDPDPYGWFDDDPTDLLTELPGPVDHGVHVPEPENPCPTGRRGSATGTSKRTGERHEQD